MWSEIQRLDSKQYAHDFKRVRGHSKTDASLIGMAEYLSQVDRQDGQNRGERGEVAPFSRKQYNEETNNIYNIDKIKTFNIKNNRFLTEQYLGQTRQPLKGQCQVANEELQGSGLEPKQEHSTTSCAYIYIYMYICMHTHSECITWCT